MLIDELFKNMQSRKQTDLILLDFSKAFDNIAHEKLHVLQNLHLYGIREDTLKWIKNFLDNRKQSVVTNGLGSVLGPILFLAYINDLPEHVRSRVRLFADDTAMYFCISYISEANIMQEDLHKLEKREEACDMSPSKCQVLHTTRLKTPISSKYSLHNPELESVSAAKYLGVTITDDLNWGTHKDNITKKANQTLGFLKTPSKAVLQGRHTLPYMSGALSLFITPCPKINFVTYFIFPYGHKSCVFKLMLIGLATFCLHCSQMWEIPQ